MLNGHDKSDSLRLRANRSGNESFHAYRKALSDVVTTRS